MATKTATKYAQGTKVPVAKTQGEVMALLKKYEAKSIAYGEEGERAFLLFAMGTRKYRIAFDYPPLDDWGPGYKFRTEHLALQSQQQEARRLWRAFLLVLKGKLVAVAADIMSFEDEFLAYALTADGRTVSEVVSPSIEANKPLLLLSAPGSTVTIREER